VAEDVVQAARDDRDLRMDGREEFGRRRVGTAMMADFEDVGARSAVPCDSKRASASDCASPVSKIAVEPNSTRSTTELLLMSDE